jgi:hypothetical protein
VVQHNSFVGRSWGTANKCPTMSEVPDYWWCTSLNDWILTSNKLA